MVMYFVVLIVLISGYFYSKSCVGPARHQNRVRRNYIVFVSIILILQSGFRNLAVGADTYAYSLSFDTILRFWSWSDVWDNFTVVYSQGEGKDAGYALIQKCFQVFFESYRVFLITIAVFFFWSFGRFLYKNTNSITNIIFGYVLYLALFYSFFSVTGLRQTIATTIVLFGMGSVQSGRWWKFILYCLVAFFVHKSAVVFVLIYLLYWFRSTKLLYTLGIVGIVLAFVFRRLIINYSYLIYYDEMRDGGLKAIPFTFIGFMILCFVFILLNISRIESVANKRILGFCNVLIIAFILAPTIGADSGTMRIVQYFSLFMVVLLPMIFDLYPRKRKLMYSLSIVILLLVLFSRSNQYAFYWQPMKLGSNYGIEKIIQE